MLSKPIQFLMAIGALASAAHGSALRKLADFDWDMVSNEDWAVAFEAAGEEIAGSYNVSTGKESNFYLEIFDKECATELTGVGVTADSASTTPGIVGVTLDLDPAELVSGNQIVTADGDNIVIEFCLKARLVLTDETSESINFHETKFNIAVDMSQGFQVAAIATARDEATQETDSVALNYTMTAILLDEESLDVSNDATWTARTAGTYGNGGKLGFVAYLDNAPSGVSIADITQFTLQGTDMAANDYLGGAFFEQDAGTYDNGKQARAAKTILASSFFTEATQQTNDASGTAILSFGRRLATRELSGESESSEFNLKIDLEGQGVGEVDEESGATVIVSTTMGASFMAVLIGSALFFM